MATSCPRLRPAGALLRPGQASADQRDCRLQRCVLLPAGKAEFFLTGLAIAESGIIWWVASSRFHRLGVAIGEATLIDLEVSPGSRRAILRLAVPAGRGSESSSRQWTVLLHGVSRLAVWLRRVQSRPDPDLYRSRSAGIPRAPRDVYPPERVPGRELNSLLRRWSGHELSGQPGEI